MRRIMVRYKVKPDQVAANERLVRCQEGIRDRCDEPPVVTELETIGSYQFTEDAA
jgi:hypothetical protein